MTAQSQRNPYEIHWHLSELDDRDAYRPVQPALTSEKRTDAAAPRPSDAVPALLRGSAA